MGYVHTTTEQRNLELMKIKAEVYSNFLNGWTSSFYSPAIPRREDLINRAKATYDLYVYAPDCVINEMYASTTKVTDSFHQFNVETFQNWIKILHNDIYNPQCDKKGTLKATDFKIIDFLK
jgi:hypothetical protein